MKIIDNVILLDFSPHAHVYLIKTGNGYVMIDTGLSRHLKNLEQELNQNNININDIKTILLTHSDVDHIRNVNVIRNRVGCEVFIDKDEIPYLLNQKRMSTKKWFFKILLRIKKIDGVKPLPQDHFGDINIIRTPGHTPGHTCFQYKDLLFAGDLIAVKNGEIICIGSAADAAQLLTSIKTIDLSKVKTICPSHGDVIQAHPAWENFIEKLKTNQ